MRFQSLKLWFTTLCILFYTQISLAHSIPNSWDVLRKQFSLNHEVSQPEVQQQIRWLITHPSYLHKLTQSEPYLYHIVTQIKKRNMPGEIALIPMIESAYDPFAYSGVGAAGLWQLMPGTGTDLGLKQDWWYDGRRSIGPSTDAALNYLAHLHRFFHGNWILAFAAYDSGEGTMARIIKNSRQNTQHVNFWSLSAPSETRAYIPRLLALAEIIQNPSRYHIKLPDIPHAPYFEEVNIGSQIDLNHAAKLAGISYHDLIKLNPGFNRWATAPYRPYKLLVPADRADDFRANLASLPKDERVSWTRHQVSAGENLGFIAKKYHTTINLIKELNQLKSGSVKKGQYVLIPSTKTRLIQAKTTTQTTKTHTLHFKRPQQYKLVHIVQRNESLRGIGHTYQVSTTHIRQWNHLAPSDNIHYGQELIIWKAPKKIIAYTVKRNDTLSQIAKSNRTSVRALTQLNPHLQKNKLKPGQSIRIS